MDRNAFEKHIAEMKAARARTIDALTAAFAASPAVITRRDFKRSRTIIYILTPSARLPGRWQVSEFGLDGPFGHQDFATPDEAIEDLARGGNLKLAKPLSDSEWMAIQNSKRFYEGSRRAVFVDLENQIRYSLPNALSKPLLDEAWRTKDLEKSITILRNAIRTWRGHA